ncbi:MAG TPA: hypothetical protein VIU46_01110 [Gallionellaceae bacterium]
MLAPVMITTYSRLDHLQRTIEALLKNELAGETSVFVYLDGPRPGDEEKVDAVRRYLGTVGGFGAFHVIARKQNMGAHENAKSANYEILDRYGKIIRMEDDIVTAPGYLKFMNQALERYKDDEKVFSISAYCPPINIPADYPYDVFFIRRFSGWGCGLWRDRLDSIYRPITQEEYEIFAADRKLSQAFVQSGGKDMLLMLKGVASGKLEAGDVMAMYTQFIKDQYTLYPTQSLVQNIGMDGTGVHCDVTDYFEVALSGKTAFNFPEHLVIDDRLVRANREYWDYRYKKIQVGMFRRVVSKLKRMLA